MYYLILIVGSIIINYLIAIGLHRFIQDNKKQKVFLIIGILFNILLLGYFKYYDFFIDNINSIFGSSFILRNIILPLGISFFTFQQLSFIVSVYKKEEKITGFLDYSLFVTFFPQLVAGPIVLYKEMMPQWEDLKNRYINYDNIAKGLYIFVIGLFKKLVIADTFALFVNNGYSIENLGAAAAWVVVIAYTIQIYFDFSGYSDMAIGLAKMFNIDLPINFNSPYKSKSITEFWRRWHITLGRAMREYIYIPLGGNRKGKIRTYINLSITFLISGLWHGASWTFIIWGALHGLFIVIERVFGKHINKVHSIIRVLSTFIIVNLLWVLFRSPDLTTAFSVYKSLFDFSNLGLDQFGRLAMDGIFDIPNMLAILYIFLVSIVILYITFFKENAISMYSKFKLNYKSLSFIIILFILSIIHLSKISPFIYFNF